jgi:hypothetical protein
MPLHRRREPDMLHTFRWLIRLAIAAALAAALSAHAADVSKADAQKIRAVVQGQLDAFSADDGKRAFSFAAPSIQQMFGTPERFMAMVREGYPVVYRPASIGFRVPELTDGVVVQSVEMTDAAGGSWLAVYAMEKQPGGQWRIAGCQVARSDAKTT